MTASLALRWLAGPALVLLAGGARAEAVPEERAERLRIAADRAQVEAQYSERELACRRQFAVTGCLVDARASRREGLNRLRQQEMVLDEAQRKQRAARRMVEIETKLSGDDARRREESARERREIASRSGQAPPAAASAPAARAPRPAQAGAARAEQAARNRQLLEAKQRAAQTHRDEVARRNAEREKKGKTARPLPAASVP